MKLIWLALLVGTLCVGQQPKVISCAGSSDGHCIPIDPPIVADTGRPIKSVINVTTKPGCEATVQPDGDVVVAPTVPAPLKCSKYQHVESPPMFCGDSVTYNPQTGKNESSCFTPRCAPDLHVVTEKEWAELKEHVRALERLVCVGGESGVLFKCTAKQLQGKEHQ